MISRDAAEAYHAVVDADSAVLGVRQLGQRPVACVEVDHAACVGQPSSESRPGQPSMRPQMLVRTTTRDALLYLPVADGEHHCLHLSNPVYTLVLQCHEKSLCIGGSMCMAHVCRSTIACC